MENIQCIYIDGSTWYPEACNVLRLTHYLHSPLEKSLMERVNQYFKDRIESFDDYYPCIQKKMNAIYFMYITGYNSLFLHMYNDTQSESYFINQLYKGGRDILN